jgi:dihydrofolate reductase
MAMTKVAAGITTSLDGYVTGPGDGPGRGLGEGGERLHWWVFGGPWTYQDEARGEATGVDKAYLEEAEARFGAVVAGRVTYDVTGAWGGRNPFGVPMFVVTHRLEDAPPPDSGFRFAAGVGEAVAAASEAAGGRDVSVMGGAEVIRQALAAGLVDELTFTIAPLVLGGGKRLFDGFDQTVILEHAGLRQSRFATHLTYRVQRVGKEAP